MKDLAKIKLLLKILSTQKIELQGAREAFAFTQAYQWLHELAKEIEKKDKPDEH